MKQIKGIVVISLLVLSLSAMITPTSSGTLTLTKGSWDVIGLDHNNVTDGPNQYVIQIHITNSAGTTAHSVTGTLTWTSTNTYINLAPNEVTTKSLGDIASGATVDLFYLIEITRDSSAYSTTRDYSISISGTDTGTADIITGSLLVERLRSQARNSVLSIVASTTTPSVGDTFTVTVVSQTGAKNYNIVNLPICGYNPTIIEPVSYSTTWVEPPDPTQTSTNVRLDLPNDDEFTSVWTFRAVGAGTSNACSYITDQSGGSFHYNADYPDIVTITVDQADLSLTKTVDDPTPNVGDTVTFTLQVTNSGSSTATNVQITDIVPSGYTYVASSMTGGDTQNDTAAPTLVWTINSLAVGSTSLTFQAVVLSSGNYKNTAQVTASDQYDPDSTPNNDDGDQSEDDEHFIVIIPQQTDSHPAIVVNKSASPSVVTTETLVNFRLTITNTGNVLLNPVNVVDYLPIGLTYANVASILPDLVTNNPDGTTTLVWFNIGPLNVGESKTILFGAIFNGTESSARNVVTVTGSPPYGPPVSHEDSTVVMKQPGTPYQPQESLQPLAHYIATHCDNEVNNLLNPIESANLDIQCDKGAQCCQAFQELVDELIRLVMEKKLDVLYPEKWKRVQELLPFAQECCINIDYYYETGNYIASIYWSNQRNQAYSEIVTILIEMLGIES